MINDLVKEEAEEITKALDNYSRGRFSLTKAVETVKASAAKILTELERKKSLDGREIRSVERPRKDKYTR